MDGVVISDELLIKALNIYQTNRLKQLIEAEERSEKHIFSPGFLAKMEKLIRMQKKSYYLFINTAAKRAALIVLLILITMFSTVFSVKALRDPAINFIIHVYEKMSTIIWGDENGVDDNLPSSILEYHEPGILPEGFILIETEDFRLMYTMTYSNQDGVKIEYQQFSIKSVHMSVDTEGTTYENIKINGNPGIYFSNKGYQNFIWNDGLYGYNLCSKITKEELQKVAESVEKRE